MKNVCHTHTHTHTQIWLWRTNVYDIHSSWWFLVSFSFFFFVPWYMDIHHQHRHHYCHRHHNHHQHHNVNGCVWQMKNCFKTKQNKTKQRNNQWKSEKFFQNPNRICWCLDQRVNFYIITQKLSVCVCMCVWLSELLTNLWFTE